MRILIIGDFKEAMGLKELLPCCCPGCEVFCIICRGLSGGHIYQEICRIQPALLITVNLAGFELLTQKKDILYNLLECKSIHLLLKKGLVNEKYLNRTLSIAMFFFCAGEEYKRYLLNKYPDIPFLETIEQKGQLLGDRDILSGILALVLRETGLC